MRKWDNPSRQGPNRRLINTAADTIQTTHATNHQSNLQMKPLFSTYTLAPISGNVQACLARLTPQATVGLLLLPDLTLILVLLLPLLLPGAETNCDRGFIIYPQSNLLDGQGYLNKRHITSTPTESIITNKLWILTLSPAKTKDCPQYNLTKQQITTQAEYKQPPSKHVYELKTNEDILHQKLHTTTNH